MQEKYGRGTRSSYVKQVETIMMTAAKEVLGCSSTTSDIVLREDLGMCPVKTIRDGSNLKCHYQIIRMPKKLSPAIADRAVWEKITKGRAGTRWDGVVEKVWKNM